MKSINKYCFYYNRYYNQYFIFHNIGTLSNNTESNCLPMGPRLSRYCQAESEFHWRKTIWIDGHQNVNATYRPI